MVTSPKLIELAHRSIGRKRRVFVTGGTGFVGASLAQVLHDAGCDVTIMGRSRFRVRSSGDFVEGDLCSEDVGELLRGHEIVFHVGALTSPWGSAELHDRVNRAGTERIAAACVQHSVERLVHVSSTAIFFDFRDRVINDSTPFPDAFCCPYAASKAAAESVIRKFVETTSLNAYIVRARAVFGPGDTTLLPRLVASAEAGKLRQIGDGQNHCDLTYIDNLIAGLLLAASPTAPVGCCTITNNEPVNLWRELHKVLGELVPTHDPRKSIPYWLADRIGAATELKHKLLRKRGEPDLTRYSVGLLGKQQAITSEAAAADLQYAPIVSVQDGIRKTLDSLRPSPVIQSSPTAVQIRYFSTGYLETRLDLAERGASKNIVRIHATVALLTHPKHGHILFDAGYSPRFFDATRRFPYRFYRWTTKVHTRAEWSPAAWIRRAGIEPSEVKLVILSHLHGDHTCGLDEFPEAEFITTQTGWEAMKGRTGMSAVKRAYLPGLLPVDFEHRLHTLNDFPHLGFGPFRRCSDLLRDGSIRIIDMGGHAKGQLGAVVNTTDNRSVLLAADAFWTRREAYAGLKPTWPFRMIADNYQDVLRTRRRVTELIRSNPELDVVCCHCPEFATEQGFDEQLEGVSHQTAPR